jgi:hypothetical protein
MEQLVRDGLIGRVQTRGRYCDGRSPFLSLSYH